MRTIPVSVPDLGDPRAVARVIGWEVATGSEVTEGEALCRITLAGGVFEIASSAKGTLVRQAVAPGAPVRAGDVVALVRETTPVAREPEPARGSFRSRW